MIYEDAIRSTDGTIDIENTELQLALGEALLRLCANAQRTHHRHEKPFVVLSIAVDGRIYCNGVAHVDRIHSNDSKYYRWHKNCLYSAAYFKEDDICDAKRTFAEQASAGDPDKPRA